MIGGYGYVGVSSQRRREWAETPSIPRGRRLGVGVTPKRKLWGGDRFGGNGLKIGGQKKLAPGVRASMRARRTSSMHELGRWANYQHTYKDMIKHGMHKEAADFGSRYLGMKDPYQEAMKRILAGQGVGAGAGMPSPIAGGGFRAGGAILRPVGAGMPRTVPQAGISSVIPGGGFRRPVQPSAPALVGGQTPEQRARQQWGEEASRREGSIPEPSAAHRQILNQFQQLYRVNPELAMRFRTQVEAGQPIPEWAMREVPGYRPSTMSQGQIIGAQRQREYEAGLR